MRNKKEVQIEVERYSPDFNVGLTDDEVSVRKSQKLTNKTELVVGKSTWEIIRTDVLSFFNIVLFVLAGLMVFGNINDGNENTKWYSGLFFILIVLTNLVLGLYQEFKAKHLMKKMKLLTTPDTKVIRNGVELSINPHDIVLDDVLLFKSSDQVTADSIILYGEVSVNESLLTGESVDVIKKKGDTIYSGTYITSGTCHARAEHVGKDNYIETISAKAKEFKRNPSHILKSLKRLFRFLGIMLISLFAIITSTYAILGTFSTFEGAINSITPLTGQFVAMIPSGLYLLTSITLATGVVSLYHKHANVQDFYSIEMLARADVLCVDKTGTITDGTMIAKEIKSLSNVSEQEIKDIIANVVEATGDNNLTADALKKAFSIKSKMKAEKVLPFNSVNKYSGATFDTGVTYLLGAGEYINLKNKNAVLEESKEYSSKGLRVLVLAKGNVAISKNKYTEEVTAVGLVILQDHIKDSAKETFKWFEENGVEIKVISGDNAMTVSQIAIEAGITNAHKYISLDGMSIEEVKAIANDYTVFGRVTPEQKEALVLALKGLDKTVAMTGDGANDMLALKRADCSIAMNSGAQAAKNVSHIVLLNNDFGTMPEIVAEGRRVINNIERTGSLFLTKTFFAVVVSIAFWVVSIVTSNKYAYPYSTNNLMVWECFGFGLSAFFISLEKNSRPIKKGFLRNIMLNAIPSGVVLVLSVLVCFLAFVFQSKGIMYTGVSEFGFDPTNANLPRTGATAISILVFTCLSLVILFNTCRPLSKYRLFVVIGSVVASATCFAVGAFIPNNIFLINFDSITNPNLMFWGSTTIIFGTILYFVKPITNTLIILCKFIGKSCVKLWKRIFFGTNKSKDKKGITI